MWSIFIPLLAVFILCFFYVITAKYFLEKITLHLCHLCEMKLIVFYLYILYISYLFSKIGIFIVLSDHRFNFILVLLCCIASMTKLSLFVLIGNMNIINSAQWTMCGFRIKRNGLINVLFTIVKYIFLCICASL